MIRKKILIIICMLITLIGTSSCNDLTTNKSKKTAIVPNTSDASAETENTISETEYIPPVTVECSNNDIHKGNLILVNKDHEYIGEGTEDLVNIYNSKHESYEVNTTEMMINTQVLDAMNLMFDDFFAVNGISDVLANSGYRSREEQQKLFDSDRALTGLENSDTVAPPGYSEHHTGYAMDFAINDGGYYPALKNEGQYQWIYNNAEKYGFILRYTEQNKDITGYAAESWHFRYLGNPHATLIKRMGISYEEYVHFIKDFSFEQPLEYKYSENELYKIYYVPADTSSNVTQIPVAIGGTEQPGSDAYSISGDNIGGFIVTLKTQELSEDYNEAVFDMFKIPEQVHTESSLQEYTDSSDENLQYEQE